jgi:hypothetical protein
MMCDDILYKNGELVQIFKFSDSRGAYSLPDEYWLSEFQEKIKKIKLLQIWIIWIN